jgi:uncharacterized protein (DUF1778 family)
MITKPTLKNISPETKNLEQELPISETIVLSGQDAVNFLHLLENPPDPSEKLNQSAQKYREKFGN